VPQRITLPRASSIKKEREKNKTKREDTGRKDNDDINIMNMTITERPIKERERIRISPVQCVR
jgi:hypothetical protein